MTDFISKNYALAWRTREGWCEGVSTVLRREAYSVRTGMGPLDVRGDDYEAALINHGKIKVFQWSDCGGSVGQHLVRATSPEDLSSVNVFRASVETPVPEDRTLAQHFSEVLKLLADGDYELVLEEIAADAYVVDLLADLGKALEINSFYPGYGALIATQALEGLSPAHVDKLVGQIQCGARPTVITLCAEGAWGEFLIDGHHKMSAYRQANVPAVRLNIIRLRSERLAIADILHFLPDTEGLKDSLQENRPPSKA